MPLMRWLLIILATLNVCYLLWAWLAPREEPATEPRWPADVPALALAPVTPGANSGASIDTSAGDGVDPLVMPPMDLLQPLPVESRCWHIGPFSEVESRQEFIATHLPDSEAIVLTEQIVRDGDWRVYLEPQADREAARQALESLRSALEQAGEPIDNFIMVDGPWENGISLGLFSQRQNAIDVQSRLVALGYEPVVEREPHAETVEWLQVPVEALPGAGDADGALSGLGEALQVTEKLCQMIAPRTDFP